MLPRWDDFVDKENLSMDRRNSSIGLFPSSRESLKNTSSIGTSMHIPYDVTQARELEIKFKTFHYEVSSEMKAIGKVLSLVLGHGIWKGDESIHNRTIDIAYIQETFNELHATSLISAPLVELFQQINSYVDMSKRVYSSRLLEMQSNLQATLEETVLHLNFEHGKTVNELHGTIEDVFKEKTKLEQQLRKQKLEYDKQIKDAQLEKDMLHAEHEGKLKQAKQQHEALLKAAKEETATQVSLVKSAEERFKERSGDTVRKVQSMAKEMEAFKQQEDKVLSMNRSLKQQIDKLEGDNTKLRREVDAFQHTLKDAVASERERQSGVLAKETSRFKDEYAELESKLKGVLAGAEAGEARLRSKYTEQLKLRVDKVKASMSDDFAVQLERLHKRHQEEIASRKRLYEDEVRVLLVELNRLRRSTSTGAGASTVGHHSRHAPDMRAPSPSPSQPPVPTRQADRPRPKDRYGDAGHRSKGTAVKSPVQYSVSSEDMPVRSQLSRQYASELESYIQHNGDVKGDGHRRKLHSRSPSRRPLSVRGSMDDSLIPQLYRYPTPPEYEAVYRSQSLDSPARLSKLSPKKDASFRFPTPPEYRAFYADNAPETSTDAVDQSESMLEDRTSVRSDESLFDDA